MAAVNLYPPIVDSYMPAFLNPSGATEAYKCRIYFSLSSLNTFNDIKYVQISVVNQKTNKSALESSRYRNGIKMIALNQPDTETGLYYADLYVGYESKTKSYTRSKRVAVVKNNYVVVIQIYADKKAKFITAYVADELIDKIKNGPKWSDTKKNAD